MGSIRSRRVPVNPSRILPRPQPNRILPGEARIADRVERVAEPDPIGLSHRQHLRHHDGDRRHAAMPPPDRSGTPRGWRPPPSDRSPAAGSTPPARRSPACCGSPVPVRTPPRRSPHRAARRGCGDPSAAIAVRSGASSASDNGSSSGGREVQIDIAARQREPDAVAAIEQQLRHRQSGHRADEPIALGQRRGQAGEQRMLPPAQHQVMQCRDIHRRHRIVVVVQNQLHPGWSIRSRSRSTDQANG